LASLPAAAADRQGRGPFVVAAALPFLLLHRNYQPGFDAGQLHVDLSDVAVLVVVVAALLELPYARPALRRARDVWIVLGLLALLVAVGTLWGARFDAYPLRTHAVTAAKWIEYILLAPALLVLCRRRGSWRIPGTALIAWSVVATTFGLLQFLGLAGDRIDHTPAVRRKPSFLGDHDLAALSGAALLYALLIAARGARTRTERRLALAAGLSGGFGLVIGGAFDSLLGTILGAIATVVLVRAARGRIVRVAAILAVITVGVFLIRSSAVADGLKFLGVKPGNGGASQHVQSYRQRALLAYIGGRIFLAHPLLGVGYDGSQDAFAYEPYLADARKHFVQPPEAFPSPAHPWGVQNAYVQSLADFGLLGLPVLLAAFLFPAWLALRRGAADVRVLAVALALLVLGAWNGYGLVAGIPLDALTWLAVGLAAVAVAADRGRAAQTIR
jgi:hypothetical protein